MLAPFYSEPNEGTKDSRCTARPSARRDLPAARPPSSCAGLMVEALLERASDSRSCTRRLSPPTAGRATSWSSRARRSREDRAARIRLRLRSRERSTRPQRSWQRVRANVPVGDRSQPFAPTLAVPEAERAHVFDDAAALADVPLGFRRPTAQVAGDADALGAALHGLYWALANLALPSGSLLSSTMRTGPTVPRCAGSNTWLRPSTTFRFCCASGSIRRT